MNYDIYNTHQEIYPYRKDDYPVIENMYIAIDHHTQKEYPCAYMIQDGKLYLPRGNHISKTENIINVKANYINESDPFEKMSRKFNAEYDPRNKLQEESINFLINEKGSQLGLNLGTGDGKTFCVAYASTTLQEKAIIITPNETLKGQWIETYHKMFDYKVKNLINIAGSNIIQAILNDEVELADIYFVNHQTLRSFMTNTNGYNLHRFFNKIKVGIKVYDESHMEFGNILLIDFFTNTNRTWYLTATFDRSDKTESVCFKKAFNSVITFGEMESAAIRKKHVIYHIVNINSRATFKEKMKINKYGRMTSASYGNYAFNLDKNQTAYNAILNIINKVKHLEGKILIFVPIIEAADKVVEQLKKDCSEKSIGAFHSKVCKSEKEDAIKKDIIVSTIKSCGTGKHIPALRVLVCSEPAASKVLASQVLGRLRPYSKDDDTYYFDIIDVCIPACIWWWKSRFKAIQNLVKKVIHLNIDN